MEHSLSLYLVRHAMAAERSDAYPDDRLRPLTPKGTAKFRKAVDGLVRLDVVVNTILTSPLVRARQTADILARGLSGSAQVVETEALCPGARLEQLVHAVAQCMGCTAIALVGHEPDIGETAGRLVGVSGSLPFNKGAVCRIDFNQWPANSDGRLRWFLTQKILRTLAH
jgi:phosphohistidine phosphatase